MKASIDSIKNKELNIMNAIEEGAKFQQFENRLNQLEHERMQIENDLQFARKKHESIAHAKIDIQLVRTNLDEFIEQMNQLSGDELHDVRSMLSQQVKRIVFRIYMFPGGYIEKPAILASLRANLEDKGLTKSEITEHISSKYKLKPKQQDRFFIMASPTGTIRIIQPNKDNPEVLHLIADGDNVAENLELQMERTAEVIEQIKMLPMINDWNEIPDTE